MQTYMQSDRGLGSEIELRLATDNKALAEKYFPALWRLIAEFENRFSRFKPQSELSLFNARAGEKMKISREFKALLEASLKFAGLSGGLFNPFVLPALQRAGYVGSMSIDAPASYSEDYSGRKTADYSKLEIGSDWAMIPEETAIDMGGIGKGYLADLLADSLRGDVPNFCLSLGGDIIAEGSEADGPWVIDIQSAKDKSKGIATVDIGGSIAGVATSGSVREKNGHVQKHLINPTTKSPVLSPYDVCSVAAKDATTADVLASCAILGGEEFAGKLVEEGAVEAVLLQGELSVPFLIGKGFLLNKN